MVNELNFRASNSYNLPYQFEDKRIPDQGFRSDVRDEFMLSWIGQLYQNNYILDNKIYKQAPEDPTYDPMQDIEGFEQYADAFVDSRNKEHTAFIKQKITLNNERRTRLEASDRVWGPALTALLADPITYIPIPLAKGVSFFTRAAKGGAYGAGLVGATELIRRPQDPTSTSTETMMMLGGSFLMSGLFAGALGRRTGDLQTPPLSPGLQAEVKKNKFFDLGDKILKNMDEQLNGHIDYEEEGIGYIWDISTTATRNTKIVEDNGYAKLQKIIKDSKDYAEAGQKSSVKFDFPPNDRYARYDEATDTIYLNRANIKLDYSEGTAFTENFIPKNAFDNLADFERFNMERAVQKAVRYTYQKYKKENPKGNPREYENTIVDRTLDEFKKRKVRGGDALNESNFLARTFRKFTNNVVRATAKINDNQWYSTVLRGFGDSGIVQRGAIAGIDVPKSAMIESATRMKLVTTNVRKVIDTQYMRSHGIEVDMLTNTSGINVDLAKKRIKEFMIKSNKKRRGLDEDLDFRGPDAFENEVTLALGSPKIFAQSDEFVQEAARGVRKILDDLNDINERLGLYESSDGYARKLDRYRTLAIKIQKDLAKVTNTEQGIEMRANLARIQEKMDILDSVAKKKAQLVPYRDKNYVPLYIRYREVAKDPAQFKKDWFNLLRRSDGYKNKKDADIKKEVDAIYENIMHTTEMGEDANILNMRNPDGLTMAQRETLKLGSANFIRRAINIDYRELFDSPVIKYYETNAKDIITRMANSTIKAQEMTVAYGDPFAEFTQASELHRLLLIKGKTKKGIANTKESLQKSNDLIERHYMVFNTADPTSITKQTVEALKDYTSLVAMGGALLSNLTELARPLMVHGFEKTFPLYKEYLIKNGDIFRTMLKDLHLEMGEPVEIALGSVHRFFHDNGYIGQSGKLGKLYDGSTSVLKKLQIPFYWLNGLTPWTIFWKNFSGLVSSHGVILDSLKIANGVNPITKAKVTAKEAQIIRTRLAAKGISEKNARLIATMPFEQSNNLFIANSSKWGTVKGGKIAREKFRQATQTDIENTIITPTITDTPNIVGGAVTLTSKQSEYILRNPMINRMLKPEKTPYGYKVNMTWGSLPFQFMPWAFGATNKMLIAGGQAFRNGEREVLMGALAMIALGGFVGYLKNPYGFSNMSKTEVVLEAVDRSGVLGIFPDLNYTLETISQGFTGNMYGVRPLVGKITGQEIGPRYGDKEFGDAVGEFLGPGPSIPIDIIRILTGGYDYNTRYDMLKILLPFQNLIGFEYLIKPLYANLYRAGYEAKEAILR
jgi:hypothetical protein